MKTEHTYHHSCDSCFFLGRTEYNGEVYDLYLHDSGSPDSAFCTTLLARFGNDCGDYLSGSEFALIHLERGEVNHPLAVALKRARERGFVKHGTLQLSVGNYAYAQAVYQPHLDRPEQERIALLEKSEVEQ